MDDHQRIQFLQGQIQCLIALCFALIETHQDKKLLQHFAATFLEGTTGKLLGEPVDEALLAGIEDMKAKLLQFLSTSAERQ